jgi:hypothetical protein
MPNPFKNSTNIQFRLLRSGEAKDQSKDDLIAIDCQGEDLYYVYYKDSDMTNPDVAHMTALSGDQLDTYLESLFYLLARDADPFRSLQVTIPCFPVIMLSIRSLSSRGVRETLNTIMPLLHSCNKIKF